MIKKIIAGVIVSCSLLLFIFFGALSLVNYNKVADNFTHSLGINAKNIGKIKINKFPISYLTIESVREEGKVDLEETKAYFSFWSLIKFNPQISELKILDAKIYSDFGTLNIYNNEDLIKKFFEYKFQDINLNITNLSIINKQDYSIINFANCLLKKETLSSNYMFEATSSQVGNISGLINNDGNIVNFSFNIDNNDYNFKLSQTYKDFKLEGGKGEYKIKNLASVMYNILPDLNHIFNKINQIEPINIKFNILNANNEIQLKDIIVESSSISGNGNINIAQNGNTTSEVKLNFSKIDLSKIFSSNSAVTFNTAPSNIRFIFADKLLYINIAIDEMILGNDNTLEKVIFTSSLLNGTLKIDEFLGNLKQGGEFKLVGNVTQNSIRSMFDGQIYLKHNDVNSLLNILGFNSVTVKDPMPFTLSSELKLTLIDMFFNNVSLKTDKLNISGNFTGKFIAQTPHLNATLSISSLDLAGQNYPIISPLIQFIESLSKDMKSLDYPSKFIPIRTNPYLANLDIGVDSVKYKDQVFDKINLLAKITPASIKISNLDFKTKNNYLSTSWSLDASSILPSLNIEIKDGNLNTDLISPKELLNLRNKLVNDYSLDKVTMQIYGKLSSLTQGELVLKNIKFYIVNNNNLLQLNNIEAELLGGKFQGSGNILLDPYSFNFVYALNTLDLDKISALLPKIFHMTGGVISINGNFSTNGNTLESQLYNLTTKSQFAINSININNFNIDSFIEKINTPNYNVQNLDKDINTAITTGQEKVTDISGEINLQKGIAILKNVNFATQYSTGAASFTVNIYNFDMDSSTMLSFYIPKGLVKSDASLANSNNSNDQNILSNISMRMQGNIFNPKKTFDSSELKKLLISTSIPEENHLTNH